jgi:RimJ/RimL family protein N-acetyltransferase
LEFLREQEGAFDRDEIYGYSLFECESDELVGGIGLHPKEETTAEIGYWVRSDRTGRGYATAAAGALTEAAFRCLRAVDRVIIRMDQANHASAAVPPKLGFTLQGEDVSQRVPSADRSGKGWLWACYRPAN